MSNVTKAKGEVVEAEESTVRYAPVVIYDAWIRNPGRSPEGDDSDTAAPTASMLISEAIPVEWHERPVRITVELLEPEKPS